MKFYQLRAINQTINLQKEIDQRERRINYECLTHL